MVYQNISPGEFRVMAAALTPYSEKGKVDIPGMRKLAGFLATRGCDGLFVPSSTGEAAMLDDPTRRDLVAAARDGGGKELEIWAGISGLGSHHAIQLSKAAACDGANGAILMAPYFVKLSQLELIDYCHRIADASPLPIGIYHHLRMPTAFEPETVAQLALHSNIVLIKDTSGDLERMEKLTSLVQGTTFRVYQGSENLLLPSLMCGATGGITAIANVLPELHRKIVDSFLEGNPDAAQAAQRILDQFWAILKRPELGKSFSRFGRSITLPLSWRGLLTNPASLNAAAHDFEEFDQWLSEYYTAHQLNRYLPIEEQLPAS